MLDDLEDAFPKMGFSHVFQEKNMLQVSPLNLQAVWMLISRYLRKLRGKWEVNYQT